MICEKVAADPELEARGSTTYCNIAVDRICSFLGYEKFKGLVANEILTLCRKSKEWQPASSDACYEAAWMGEVAIAGQSGEPNGHLAVIYPDTKIYSGKWKKYVPKVANVGKRNGIMGVSYAFREEPDYFILRQGARKK